MLGVHLACQGEESFAYPETRRGSWAPLEPLRAYLDDAESSTRGLKAHEANEDHEECPKTRGLKRSVVLRAFPFFDSLRPSGRLTS